jgi:hypothetical protein
MCADSIGVERVWSIKNTGVFRLFWRPGGQLKSEAVTPGSAALESVGGGTAHSKAALIGESATFQSEKGPFPLGFA